MIRLVLFGVFVFVAFVETWPFALAALIPLCVAHAIAVA